MTSQFIVGHDVAVILTNNALGSVPHGKSPTDLQWFMYWHMLDASCKWDLEDPMVPQVTHFFEFDPAWPEGYVPSNMQQQAE